MNKYIYIVIMMIGLLLGPGFSLVYGQLQHDLGYIYGTVETKSGKAYEGFLRWGKEEIAWHDVFNSTKKSNAFRKPKNSKNSWGDMDWNFSSLWRNNYNGTSRVFACLFGDIQELELLSRSRVNVHLKNGERIQVEGGSNDIGAKIYISDPEIGSLKLSWNNISTIKFHEPPRGAKPPHDPYLFGKVEAGRGQQFEGYIKWDNDERVLSDILDGKGCNEDGEIAFEHIKCIKKEYSNAVLVSTHGGDHFKMSGTNDVNSGNQGIHVYVSGVGNIEVPWRRFKNVEFIESSTAGPPYIDFQIDDGLHGQVTTYNGEKHDGMIIFDMDEMYGAEILDGEDDYIMYQIPMRNIAVIRPKNSSYSYVELKNGQSLLLGDTQDVSDNNDGVIIINSKNNLHIDWDDIDEIVFR